MLNHFVRFTTQLPKAEVRRITAKVTFRRRVFIENSLSPAKY
jgi:hypothetical protein